VDAAGNHGLGLIFLVVLGCEQNETESIKTHLFFNVRCCCLQWVSRNSGNITQGICSGMIVSYHILVFAFCVCVKIVHCILAVKQK
jgi:hypothetical protein